MSKLTTTLEWQTPSIGVIRNFLTKTECEQFIYRGENSGFETATINGEFGAIKREDIRNNSRVITDDSDLAVQIWSKLKGHIEDPLLGRWKPTGLNERFRFYRYQEGQQFDWHIDGTYRAGDGSQSVLTFMVYLNDGFGGGDTIFGSQDGPDYHESHRIKPEEGMALLFFHRVLHKGAPVHFGKKYVLRSDVMFERLAL